MKKQKICMTYNKQQMTDKNSVLSLIEYKRTKYHINNSRSQTRFKKNRIKLYIAHVRVLFRFNYTNRLKAKFKRKVHADCKKPRLPILKSHKKDFKTINITRKRDIS